MVLPARRGALYDRNGMPLAITQEFYHVGVAPNELEDVRTAFVLLVRNLGVSAPALNREFQARKRWIYLHGPFNATQVQALRQVKGIHLTGEFQRFYPSRELARPIIGGLAPDRPVGAAGLEGALDSLLTGRAGRGGAAQGPCRAGATTRPARKIRDPVSGNDVMLTIDAELQEIAERGLDDAIAEMQAEGGDVVFLDPTSGELLALASRQAAGGGAPSASTFTDPFEPGSTAKLFTAAALLMRGRVEADRRGVRRERRVEHAGDTKRAGRGASPTRTRSAGTLTLARAIQVSSNIAMAKFSSRLRPEEQFETLRDFGFGTPDRGRVPWRVARASSRGPDRWQPMYTRASLAMGYEFGVTPVQLAAAYAAIANDGVLLAPTLVREVRDPAGNAALPAPAGAGAAGGHLRDRGAAPGVPARGGGDGRAPATRRSWPTTRCSARPGPPIRFQNGRYVRGQYTASFAAHLSRRPSAARGDRQDRQPAGQLLRRAHRRAGDAHDAPAGAGLAPGGDRPRPPRGARHRADGGAAAGRRRPSRGRRRWW